MNKTGFIKKLSKELNCDEDKARRINYIIEDTSLIGEKNKEKMVSRFISDLNMTEEEADNTYNKCMDVITSSMKNKILHPFKKDE